jgi:hypothetical protein
MKLYVLKIVVTLGNTYRPFLEINMEMELKLHLRIYFETIVKNPKDYTSNRLSNIHIVAPCSRADSD